jgi:uncharacterized protein (TIGR00251 family)
MSSTQWTVIQVKITPKAKNNSVVGWENGELKIRIAAVPEKGEANLELIRFLSEFFGVAKAHIHIHSGLSSRHKKVELYGISLEQIKDKVIKRLAPLV